jgi:hypothetical protein
MRRSGLPVRPMKTDACIKDVQGAALRRKSTNIEKRTTRNRHSSRRRSLAIKNAENQRGNAARLGGRRQV